MSIAAVKHQMESKQFHTIFSSFALPWYSFLIAHRNLKVPSLRCDHMCPLLTTTDLSSNEPQECLFLSNQQQFLFLMCCYIFTYKLASLVPNSSLSLQVAFPVWVGKITNIKLFLILAKGCKKKKNLPESWEKYDNTGFYSC